jgi:hypothetical protein
MTILTFLYTTTLATRQDLLVRPTFPSFFNTASLITLAFFSSPITQGSANLHQPEYGDNSTQVVTRPRILPKQTAHPPPPPSTSSYNPHHQAPSSTAGPTTQPQDNFGVQDEFDDQDSSWLGQVDLNQIASQAQKAIAAAGNGCEYSL